ncbi:MAG TPA: PAS domain-containing protein, partial [Isosphaeraceae bacterium]|nr:PAS domain-containing protein [Isosphaeraceae bacterium]
MNQDQSQSDSEGKGFADENLIRFHELFEFAPHGQIVTDGVGVIERANLAASFILGCSKEFLIGKPLGLFMAPGYRRRFYESLLRRLPGATGSDEFESKTGRPDVPHDVLIRVSP